jgi:aminopeptidase N
MAVSCRNGSGTEQRAVMKYISEQQCTKLVSYIVFPLLLHYRYLATTHFEPTYARSAFPCFDEPQFKARFKMSIFRDRFHIALFNMPVINTEDAGFYMGTGLVSLL